MKRNNGDSEYKLIEDFIKEYFCKNGLWTRKFKKNKTIYKTILDEDDFRCGFRGGFEYRDILYYSLENMFNDNIYNYFIVTRTGDKKSDGFIIDSWYLYNIIYIVDVFGNIIIKYKHKRYGNPAKWVFRLNDKKKEEIRNIIDEKIRSWKINSLLEQEELNR